MILTPWCHQCEGLPRVCPHCRSTSNRHPAWEIKALKLCFQLCGIESWTKHSTSININQQFVAKVATKCTKIRNNCMFGESIGWCNPSMILTNIDSGHIWAVASIMVCVVASCADVAKELMRRTRGATLWHCYTVTPCQSTDVNSLFLQIKQHWHSLSLTPMKRNDLLIVPFIPNASKCVQMRPIPATFGHEFASPNCPGFLWPGSDCHSTRNTQHGATVQCLHWSPLISTVSRCFRCFRCFRATVTRISVSREHKSNQIADHLAAKSCKAHRSIW